MKNPRKYFMWRKWYSLSVWELMSVYRITAYLLPHPFGLWARRASALWAVHGRWSKSSSGKMSVYCLYWAYRSMSSTPHLQSVVTFWQRPPSCSQQVIWVRFQIDQWQRMILCLGLMRRSTHFYADHIPGVLKVPLLLTFEQLKYFKPSLAH